VERVKRACGWCEQVLEHNLNDCGVELEIRQFRPDPISSSERILGIKKDGTAADTVPWERFFYLFRRETHAR
jgi:hypothetical protein